MTSSVLLFSLCTASRSHCVTELGMATSNLILLLPYPSQGHINPMLQFGKRCAAQGASAILATTRFILNTTRPQPGPVHLAAISDGCDRAGYAEVSSIPVYLDRLERVGSETLEGLIRSEAAAGRPVRLLVYDAFLPWAGDVGRRLGLATAAFFTQSCAVNALYFHVWEGRLRVPVQAAVLDLPGLPRLRPRDLPSFLPDRDSIYPAYLQLVLNQFKNLEKADEVLVNTFYELEPQESEYLKVVSGARTIGPTVPSRHLDGRFPSDSHYGFHLLAPSVAPCMNWLDSKPPASVVYVSFGSMAALCQEQVEELAQGLSATGKHFLWVVRSSEADKLPPGFVEGCGDRGLVVPWSPQLEVLAHPATGCFLTHCGWNSMVEGLSLGVPMVAMPQWTDQPTNAMYVEEVWGVGVRVREDGEGLVRRVEVEWCVREVMEGDRSSEMRRNAARWRTLAKAAASQNGSSDKNIVELIAKYCSKAGKDCVHQQLVAT
ncbi:unnamed protein product [Musa textilis]